MARRARRFLGAGTPILGIALGMAMGLALGGCGAADPASPPPSGGPGTAIPGTTRLDLSFVERGTGPVTSLVLNPATVRDLNFILTGADADLFDISSVGDLHFRSPPVFAAPQDGDRNNVYEVLVTATDRGAGVPSTVSIRVSVTAAAAAVRFVDQVFASASPLGGLTLPAPSGNLPITLLAPTGDRLSLAPLVVVGSEDARQLAWLADEFARRGYLVAAAPTGAPQDLREVALALRNEPVAGLPRDPAAMAVVGAGRAANEQELTQTLADSGMPSFALMANMPVRDAAQHFYNTMIAGEN